MNPISDTIIERNKESIVEITKAYKTFSVPAFIRIEAGTYGRNIVTPILNMTQENNLGEFSLVIYEQFFSYGYNPVFLIKKLTEKKEIYLKTFSGLKPGQALIGIDYEAEGVRSLFDPIVWNG